ncbi:uncharacterized protein LOC111678897 [Lucilia cuprina]|uniref:uncharacterized protein LOC111678897 n=1 Tax=Lucilia cuprina TaxID=7375 RepID=UPI001F05130A|nr:uncharacterized protein LOC111678897 [Lucilia cuprina]
MSHQIKSTSYFQRMLTKSKQNGQLQMLQKEYERVNFLNESKIEMKMRQIRLNKLFKEIEQIKKCDLKRRNRLHFKRSDRPKTKETERMQNFKKARNLGQYFSQRNLRTTIRKKHQLLRKRYKLEDAQPETSVSKRNKYGNEISNWNRQKFLVKNARKEFRTFHKELTINVEKQTSHFVSNTLKNNGINTTSKIHGEYINSNDCISLQIDRNSNAKTSVLTLSENVHLIDLQICDKMHEALLTNDDSLQIIVPRAVKNWQKLAILIRDKFQIYRSNKVCDLTDYKARPLNNKQLECSENIREGSSPKTPSLPESMPILIQKSKYLKPLHIPAEDMYNPCWEEINYSSKFSVGKLRRLFENVS